MTTIDYLDEELEGTHDLRIENELSYFLENNKAYQLALASLQECYEGSFEHFNSKEDLLLCIAEDFLF